MRFMHLADVHLGLLPDKDQRWSEQRRDEIFQTFRQTILSAPEKQIDLILIAGDLFHGQPLKKDLKEVNYLFEKIRPVRVVLIAGNHDYIRKDSCYLNFTWAENVTMLNQTQIKSVTFADIQTTVYGCSYHTREIRDGIYDGCKPDQNGGIHILLGHGGDATHAPFDYRTLIKNGFDYYAFGHIHKPFVSADRKFAYAGSLEPTDRNDYGHRGYLMGKIDEETGKISLKFIAAAKRQYIRLLAECDQQSTSQSVAEDIRKLIIENGEQNIYQVVLRGIRDEAISFDPQPYLRDKNIIGLEDQTQVSYDYEELEQSYSSSIVGQVIHDLKDEDQQAMFFAVNALMRTKR